MRVLDFVFCVCACGGWGEGVEKRGKSEREEGVIHSLSILLNHMWYTETAHDIQQPVIYSRARHQSKCRHLSIVTLRAYVWFQMRLLPLLINDGKALTDRNK